MNANEQDKSPLEAPMVVDPNWQAKIQKAKEAREMGSRQREGKELSFRKGVGRMAPRAV